MPIKLSATRKKPSDAFLDEFWEKTKPHPFDSRTRLYGHAAIHLSPMSDGRVHMHDIMTLSPKSGAGTSALKFLISLADKHGTGIHGVAKAYTGNSDHLDQKKLVAWYKKHGFSSRGDEITYTPKPIRESARPDDITIITEALNALRS